MRTENSLLERIVIERIAREGPLTVAEYMAMALSHPGHGYYMTKDPLGQEGDFVTAPEVSQLFGEMIAAWFTDIWLQAGKPMDVNLVELGPGRGTLSADILRTLSAWPALKESVTAHLVEISPVLRAKQKQALEGQRAVWHDRFDSVPDGFSFVIANEFFDALPIHQFEKHKGKWQERYVNCDAKKEKLYFALQEPGINFESLMPAEFLNAEDGSVFEISPVSLTVVETLARRISLQGGAALVFDYGHIVPGIGDTLQAVYRHAYADPLQKVGCSDITAHVDFATLATVAGQHACVHGPTEQGKFLMEMGIETRAQKLRAHVSPGQRSNIMASMRRLVSSQEMGWLFKTMALTPKGNAFNVVGFGEGK